ncbi:sigma-54-dependent Fis family transcriptional regulator [Pseudonocardia hispaniensis]|uniref:Sigma-54-dependent Fis family transcriptional regulator n=1 Tax=Pseudonocardia hispaniensis TaxID=904933 RepID=A0ABW1J1A1_9PSEU
MRTGTAWEQFQTGEEPRDVRGEVLTSWRRSRINGVDPEYVDVPYVETDVDTQFVRVAVPILTRMAELITGEQTCLALADASGRVVWRWVSEPALRNTLDALSVDQGYCFDEEFVGTNGLGTSLETGRIAIIRGSEHFVHRFHSVTCVAAPVRHPITRRTLGAVNVTCRAEHTSSLLSVVVLKLVDEIRAGLLAAAAPRERQLLDGFLCEQRRTTAPVISVGEGIVIANRAAVELGLDQHELWDELRGAPDGARIDLRPDLSGRLRLLRDGLVTTGAVLTLSGPVPEPTPRRRTRDEPVAPSIWERLLAQAEQLVGEGPLTVRGEPGTGKATLLTAALTARYGVDPVVVDAATCPVEGLAVWAGRFGAHLADPEVPLVLRHAELLSEEAARAVGALLAGGQAPLGVTLTVSDASRADIPGRLLDRLGGAAITIPPLRRRTADIIELASRELREHGARLSFALEAQTALRRYDWPGNGRELAAVVREAARHSRGGVVGLDALPAEVRAASGRRVLTPLERAESSVIAAVLQECGGNKSAAAKELGISRTALYAKIRSYRL